MKGRITRIVSPHENELKDFTYETNGAFLANRLLGFKDSFGRNVYLRYDNNSQWVTRIEGPTGRDVLYSYDNEGRLLSVESPLVTDPCGFDGPRKMRRYEYRNHTEDDLKYALAKIWAPNQSNPGDAERLSWTYDENHDKQFDTFGYVISHTVGNQDQSLPLELRARRHLHVQLYPA